MTGSPFDALAILKEYGLAGVMAWLFWWTLRRMMASHDSIVRGLEEQLAAQAQATQSVGESFSRVVQNHMDHVTNAIARFEASLAHHAEAEQRWQGRLLATLDMIVERLSQEVPS